MLNDLQYNSGIAFTTLPVFFPYLQKLSLERFHVDDMIVLVNLVDCPSLDSLAIGGIFGDVTNLSEPRSESTPQMMFVRKLTQKFPYLFRLAYAPAHSNNWNPHRDSRNTFDNVLRDLLRQPWNVQSGTEQCTWLLLRLRVLELVEDAEALQWLIPLVSARLLSSDATNLHTLHFIDDAG